MGLLLDKYMYKKNKKRNKFIIGFVIFIGLILSSFIVNKNFNLSNSFIKDGILFIDKYVSMPIKSLFNQSNDLASQNADLKRELEILKIYENENIELREEISKLKEVLEINNLLSDKEYINASVINRDLNYWQESLTIDKGSNSGIFDNMAVVSNGSLVGITGDVSHFNSTVYLLCNSKFPMNISVKVVFEDKELFGILNNYNVSNNNYEVMGIVENVLIPEDAMVVTTGLGNIFPSGLLVGYVEDVVTDNFDLSKIIKVKPSVDFDNISYVTVVKREEK